MSRTFEFEPPARFSTALDHCRLEPTGLRLLWSRGVSELKTRCERPLLCSTRLQQIVNLVYELNVQRWPSADPVLRPFSDIRWQCHK